MNKSFLIPLMAFGLLISNYIYAQAPSGINYQAVARDSKGDIMQNKSLSVKAIIATGSSGSNLEYTETHSISTNDFGLFNIIIGQGSTSDNFGALTWGTKKHHLKIEIDAGSGFVSMGTIQFESVPYALNAKNVENIPTINMDELGDVNSSGATSGQVLSWDGSSWKPVNPASGPTYTAGNGININSGTIEATSTVAMWNANKLSGGSVLSSTPSSGEALKWNGSAWAPASDNNTTYTGGTGISVNSGVINADNTSAMWNANSFQGRTLATTAPSSGQVMKWNGSNWAPAADNGATYTASTGLTLTGTAFSANTTTALWNANQLQGRSVANTAPSTGQVIKWNGSNWAPGSDNGKNYTASTGLTLTGTAFSANTTTALWNANQLQGRTIATSAPSNGQVMKWNGSTWAPAADNGASYSAGTGISLSGNSIIASTNSALWNANKIQGRNVSSTAPTTGQALAWNGSNWTPTTISGGSSSSLWTAIGTTGLFTSKTVNIGNASQTVPLSVFDTITNSTSASQRSILVQNWGSQNNQAVTAGIWSSVYGRKGYENIGVRGWAGDTAGSIYAGGGSVGGYFIATGSGGSNNFGVRGAAFKGAVTRDYAVYAHSTGDAVFNMGVFAYCSGSHNDTNKTNYGIYAWADSAKTNYAGYFSGNVTYSGTLASASDARLKKNIVPLENALTRIRKVQVSNYEYRSDGIAAKMVLPKGKQIGFIAQDLEKSFPELVQNQVHATGAEADAENTETISYKAVNYIGMVPVLTKAIQEQQEYIEHLEKRLVELESKMNK